MAGRIVYTNKTYYIEEKLVRKAGHSFTFQSIVYPDIVVMLPLLPGNRVVVERQYRANINKYIYELPAGKIEGREKPALAARRELEEETGYHASTLQYIGRFYTDPGFVTESANLFVAKDLVKRKTNLDKDEIISVEIMGMERLLRMIRENRITDMKTISCVLYYLNLRQQSLNGYRKR